jgi:hypothetical protein
MMTTPQLMETGDVVWRNTSSLAPGGRAELEFLVSVQATGGSSLVSQGYTVQADDWTEPLTGPSITIAVVTPTATLQPAEVITGDDGHWLGLGAAGLALLLGAVAVERWLNRGANR